MTTLEDIKMTLHPTQRITYEMTELRDNPDYIRYIPISYILVTTVFFQILYKLVQTSSHMCVTPTVPHLFQLQNILWH